MSHILSSIASTPLFHSSIAPPPSSVSDIVQLCAAKAGELEEALSNLTQTAQADDHYLSDTLKREISAFFLDVFRAAEDQRSKLLIELSRIRKERAEELSNQKKVLEATLTDLRLGQELGEKLLLSCDSSEFGRAEKDVVSTLSKLVGFEQPPLVPTPRVHFRSDLEELKSAMTQTAVLLRNGESVLPPLSPAPSPSHSLKSPLSSPFSHSFGSLTTSTTTVIPTSPPTRPISSPQAPPPPSLMQPPQPSTPSLSSLRPPFLFDSSAYLPRLLRLSDDRTTVTAIGNAHASILGDKGFSRGRHTWRVRLNSLKDNKRWIAIGVAPKPLPNMERNYFQSWSSSTNDQVFEGPKLEAKLSAPGDWKEGDTLELTLNCDEGTLTIQNLGTGSLRTIRGVSGEVYFFVNMYVAGNSVTLLS